MAISDIFELGKQGLNAHRKALQTTTNNIANANTPGYSRQRPVFETREQGMRDGVIFGGGVDVPKVIRVHDDFVQRQIIDESKNLGTYKTRSEIMKQVENLYNKEGFELGNQVGEFFNRYRELSAQPESAAIRSSVAESAQAAANSFRNLNEKLENLKHNLDVRLESNITEINSQTKELAGLNDKISQYLSLGQEPNELLDRRDMIVRDLSQKLGFSLSTNERGHVNVMAAGFGVLVNGGEANELVTLRSPEAGTKSAGLMDVYVKDGFGLHKVTQTLKEGELAGLIQVRDQVITDAQEKLDHQAFAFSQNVNELHKQGSGLDGLSERGLFIDSEEIKGTAGRMDLSEHVKKSFEAVATGLFDDDRGGPGDNRVALGIADLQNKALIPTDGILREGAEPRFTFNEGLNAMMGSIGSQTAREDLMMKHQEGIVSQLNNYRESISGVSLEEEAISMMQYQAAFNASAKALKTGDELLQAVLSLKN
jgi:flagellar hook-associated protein 1 FlgK